MKTIRFFRLLVLRIVILSACVMAWSFLTELIETTTFFKDVSYKKYEWSSVTTDWGWRHYVWAITGGILVIVSIARIIVWSDWYWEQMKREDNVDLKSPENKIF